MKVSEITFILLVLIGLSATNAWAGSTVDYGDAPDPTYPTLLANDGARHNSAGFPTLGTTVDNDLDGQPNATATGDDTNGADDEDGVTFTSALTAGSTAGVDVVISGTSGDLNAWIDFNADGDWTDPGEQIFTDQAVPTGTNSLTFPVPPTANPGTTFARFRVNTTGGLAPTGAAANGEVEDYQVTILAAAIPVLQPLALAMLAGLLGIAPLLRRKRRRG